MERDRAELERRLALAVEELWCNDKDFRKVLDLRITVLVRGLPTRDVIVSLNRIRHPLKDPGWTPPQARGGFKKNC